MFFICWDKVEIKQLTPGLKVWTYSHGRVSWRETFRRMIRRLVE